VVRSALVVTSLLGSGFAAARWGKCQSIGVSCLVIGLGMLLYSLAPGYGVILLGAALLGTGGGVVEGLLNPLIQDLHPKDSGRYLNLVNGFWSVGVLVTMLGAGELLTLGISWRMIAAVLGGVCAVSGLWFIVLRGTAPTAPRYRALDVLSHKKEMMSLPRFWLFMAMMFLAGAAEGAFTFWTASFIQLQFETLPRAGGVGAALFAGGMVAGRFGAGLWVRQHQLSRLILVAAAAGAVLGVVVPFLPTLYWLFPGLFLVGISIAVYWPSIQSYAADRLPVESTSLFILLSCAGIPGFAFATGWGYGRGCWLPRRFCSSSLS
jgi:MFS family permease